MLIMEVEILYFPLPKIDENLMGYLIRIAQRNHSNIGWIYDSLKFNYSSTLSRPNANNISPEKLNSLSLLTGMSIEVFRNMSYFNDKNTFVLYGHEVSKKYVNTRKVKLCSLCLKEDLYIRKIWDLTLVTSCPIHKCLLIDTCSKCSQIIPWYRSEIEICSCGNNLSNELAREVNTNEVMLENHIHSCCHLITDNSMLNEHSLPYPIKHLKLNQIIKLIPLFAWYSPERPKHWTLIGNSISNYFLHNYFVKAVNVFVDWPNNFFEYLNQIIEYKGSKSLQNTFGWLYKVISNENDYEEISNEFNAFLDKNWKNGYLKNIKINNLPLEKRTHLSATESRDLLRVKGTHSIRQLITEGEINGSINESGNQTVILVESNSLKKYKVKIEQKNEQKFSMKKVETELGVTHTSVLKILSRGLITAIHGPQIDGKSIWQFSKESVQNLLQVIEENCKSEEVSVETLISFSHYIRIGALTKNDIGVSTENLFNGIIKAYKKQIGKGLNKFYFNIEDVKELYPYYETEKISGLDYQETCSRLGVNAKSLSNWFKKGFIPFRVSKFGGKKYVMEKDLKVFQEKYITLAEISKIKNDFFYRGLYHSLKEKGITAISGPKIDGSVQYLFLRNDVTNFLKSTV